MGHARSSPWLLIRQRRAPARPRDLRESRGEGVVDEGVEDRAEYEDADGDGDTVSERRHDAEPHQDEVDFVGETELQPATRYNDAKGNGNPL